ncbi:hypothetical protein [Streptomyces sp. NPDC050560]|uniref:hypothetical protein n=1 Tax=Streptomyces sp. NPDC050560 TaxID=3365630 RepID=UPI0037AB8D21
MDAPPAAPTARRAAPADAEEIVRLRKIMLDSFAPSDDTSWIRPALADLRERLEHAPDTLAVYVVDDPSGTGLGRVVWIFVDQGAASDAVHRKAEDRPRTGRTWTFRQRGEVP